MAIYSVTGAELTSVADAIRAKGGTTDLLAFPSGFVSAVQDITTGGMSLSAADEGKVVYNGALSLQGSMSVMSNGSYDTTLFSQVSVAIPDAVLVSKTITSNGIYNPFDDNADGFSQVSVAIPEAVLVSKTIISNGTYNPASDNADAYSQVVVSVPSEGGGGSIGSENYLILARKSSGTFNDSGLEDVSHYAFYGNDFINEFIAENAITVGSHTFQNCFNLSKISIPKCSFISESAFYCCSKLESLYLPVCSKVSNYGFYGCVSLSYVNLSQCKEIGGYAFNSCTSLIYVNAPECTSIGSYGFAKCNSLESCFIPEIISINASCFTSCWNLSEISLLNCKTIGGSAFRYCSSLGAINLPLLTVVNAYTFAGCIKLSEAYLPKVSNINASAFDNCINLEKVVLLSTSVANLITITAFDGTPISKSSYLGYFGSVYVPASLVDAYKSASNWSAYSDRITSYVEG